MGLIHVWVAPKTENWSAYAPGFEEFEENREYDEAEDEFDIVGPLSTHRMGFEVGLLIVGHCRKRTRSASGGSGRSRTGRWTS